MNERFFDLKKDRQDQIINGAMRIFAENGYRHASTDEMVGAAGISKGLLFHYFKSKKGTFRFLYEYGTRYLLVELRDADRRAGCDFFEMYRLLIKADSAALRNYPFLLLFLKRADRELDAIKAEIPQDLSRAVAQKRRELIEGSSGSPFLSSDDAGRIAQLLEYTREGLIRELLETAPAPAKAAGRKNGAQTASETGREPEAAPSGVPLPLHKAYEARFLEVLRTIQRMNL